MPKLFTVGWPLFARLESLLLFPVSLLLAAELARVRVLVDVKLVPDLSPLTHLGVPDSAIFWLAVAIVVIVPYFVILLVADRLLTVRKGYALLSIAAVAVWAGAAMHLSDQLVGLVPTAIMDKYGFWPASREATLTVGGFALLLHLWPLWVGLNDTGDVAIRLIDPQAVSAHYDRSDDHRRRLQDVYYRQTAEFREWQPQEQLSGLAPGPREHTTVKIISAVTWIGLITGGAFAYHNWDTIASRPPAPEVPRVAMGGTGGSPGMPLGPPASAAQAPGGHTFVPPPLPEVQRPGEMFPGMPASSPSSGPNEAVSDRGADGSFGFEAMVNGSRVQMLFDTGASVVALRAEDAERIGINMTRLRYSATVKTANGTTEVAPIIIASLKVGNITQRNISGYVARQGVLQENLLGQSFLERLSGYNVDNNQLVLKGR
jgi:clan AA aspartic protease (TIGR02281 family)